MQKILVIDDDECLRDTIGVMLERESYTPLFAADGKGGFEKALALNRTYYWWICACLA